MKKNRNWKLAAEAVFFLTLFVASTFVVVGDAQAAIQCYQCHGTTGPADYRPVDAAYRNISTGGFKGNHRTHMGIGATPTSCNPCHGNGVDVSTYLSRHRNGRIEMVANINNSPKAGGAAYSKGVFFNQTSVPITGTCSNVNCHFESTTSTWGSTAFASPNDCNKCHGLPPNGGATGAAGSHTKHDTYYSGAANCAKCHSDHTAEADKFGHATSAGKRDLNVSFAAAPNNGSGAYSGALNDYLPSQANAFGNCTATYCHSPGNKSSSFDAPITIATWGGTLTCKGCHKADIASGSYITSGSHLAHVNGSTLGYNTIKCVSCHQSTSTADMVIADTTMHVNKKVEVAFDNTSSAANGSYNGQLAKPGSPSTKDSGTGFGSCTSVYCHSTGQGANGTWPPTYQSPTWGTAAQGQCGTCHGIQTKHDATGFGYGTPTPMTSGSHTEHLKYLLGTGNVTAERKCAACHSYTLTGYSPSACGSASCHNGMATKHANYEINVGIPDYYGASASYSGTTKPGDGYGSCSSNYCHSDGLPTPLSYATPTWGTPASGSCGTCHGATATAPPASIPHAKHTGIGSQYRYACAECHSGKVQATADSTTTPAFTNLTSHVNKLRDVKFDATNTFGTYSSAITTCRNLYCHSTGNTSVAAGDLPSVYGGKVYARQGWTGSVSCSSCHGRSTSNGMPDYTNAGAAGSATANSHPKHVTSSAIACVECHEKTTKTGTSIRNTTPSKHVDGTNHDVYFNLSGLSPSGTYDNALKKCSTTYCHGTGASLAWGGNTMCNSCHSANDAVSGGGGVNNWGAGISAHTLHVEETTLLPSKYTNYSAGNLSSNTAVYRFGCASCHNPAQASHVSGYASGSYRAQVFFGYTSPGKKPTYTYTGAAGTTDNGFSWSNGNTTCTSTYCHSNGAGGAGNTAVSWATTANSATNTRCKACHNYTAASGAAMATNTHGKHISGSTYGMSCAKCHNGTTTDGTNITDKTKHVNKVVNVVYDATNFDGSAYSDPNCANIYCHSKGTTIASPYSAPNTPAAWGGALDATCSGCHGGDNSATSKMGTVGTTTHTKHVQTYGFGCVKCHETTVSANRTISNYASHVNKLVNIEFNNSTTAVSGTYNGSASPMTKLPGSAVGACSNTYCHSNGTSVSSGSIPVNTTDNWGTAGPLACDKCHGNATYPSDLRKAAPLYADGSPKANAHVYHTKVGALSGTYMACDDCHAGTTQNGSTIADTTKHVNKGYDVNSIVAGVYSTAFRDGDNTMDSTKVTLNYTYNASGSSCSNVSCHPVAADLEASPPVEKTRAASSVKWNKNYRCVDCHNVAMEDNNTFHHAMRNYSTSYPVLSPYSSSNVGQNVYARRCTMCHVDHNIFSPDLNSSSPGRSYNLRSAIGTTPNASTGFTNTDFIETSGGSGGICVSCHSTAKRKDTVRRRNDSGARYTPVITMNTYSGAAHQYGVSAKFMSDSSVFYGDCSKCHNALLGETSVFMNATSAYQFGNHNSGIRRLQGSLGAAGGETAEEQVCYRCHSHSTDSDPGGGPPKAVDGKDFYGVANMSAASEGIFQANKYFRTAGTTSTVNKLFFKPTGAENPSENMPNATTNDADLGDTFAGGTYVVRSMSPWDSSTAYETKSQATDQSGTKYWKMVKFVSPPIDTGTTVPAGTWTINMYSRESRTSQNARIRYMIYKWNVGGADSKGTTLIAKGTYATELTTNAAPGNNVQIGVNVPTDTTFAAGEKIVVDLALETTASYSTSYTASYYYGKGAPSNMTMPGSVTFTYADPGSPGFGHGPSGYAGIHKPSPQDETQAFISSNKHVECNDCHNPHAAKAGNHTANDATIARVLRGVSGVKPNYAGSTNWSSFANYSSTIEARKEYQICFKCHSVANTNVTSWGGGGAASWTNLGLEFNPANKAGHPIVASLNNSAGRTAAKALGAAALKAPWNASPGNNIMTCSDCHASDSAVSKGPHGSSVKWMLAGTNKAWPFTLASQNGGSTGTTFKLGTYSANNGTNDGLFCLNCHTVMAATKNAFHANVGGGQHSGWASAVRGACVSCHIRVPHGGKVSRLIRPGTAAVLGRYAPDGNGAEVAGQSQQVMTSFDKPATWGAGGTGYLGGSGSCGCHSGGAETW